MVRSAPTFTLPGFGAAVSVPVSAGVGAVTVMLVVAVSVLLVQHAPEPFAVTVMVAVPAATPVTTPVALTDAMLGALETNWYVTLAPGSPVAADAERVAVVPTTMLDADALTLTEVIASGFGAVASPQAANTIAAAIVKHALTGFFTTTRIRLPVLTG